MERLIKPPIQDVPPPGGYPAMNLKRNVGGNRGPPGYVLWGAMFGLAIYGFYKLSGNMQKKRLRRKETRDCRLAVIPYLMAETDMYLSTATEALRIREKHVMRNEKDWIIDRPRYSNPQYYDQPSNIERLYPEVADNFQRRIYYAPEYNNKGVKSWWGGGEYDNRRSWPVM